MISNKKSLDVYNDDSNFWKDFGLMVLLILMFERDQNIKGYLTNQDCEVIENTHSRVKTITKLTNFIK